MPAPDAGPTEANSGAEAIPGADAAAVFDSMALAVVFHCTTTVPMQRTSVDALRKCLR